MTRLLVLNVDSDPETRKAVSGLLAQEGRLVRDVASADQCLQLVQEKDPDLVVISPNPDGMDGAELCRRLGKLSAARRILRILPASNGSAKAISESGADAFVPEKLDPVVLANTAGSLLRLREVEQNCDETKKALAVLAK